MSVHAYKAYYCEENIYKLCQEPQFDEADVYILFISNPSKTVAMWSMRSGGDIERYVIWDYHVVLFHQDKQQIWDLDCLKGFPLSIHDWIQTCFRVVPNDYQPQFRKVPRNVFLQHFKSNRSHMLKGSKWLAEPPDWPSISTDTNLAQWYDMSAPFFGQVLDLPGLFKV